GERRPEAGADEDLQHQRGQWHDGKPGSGAGRALPDGHFVVLPGAALMACRRKLVWRKRGADTRVCHLVLGLQWWSGPPACHVAISWRHSSDYRYQLLEECRHECRHGRPEAHSTVGWHWAESRATTSLAL